MFKIGQKVVCINDNWNEPRGLPPLPKKGEIYTSDGSDKYGDGIFLRGFDWFLNSGRVSFYTGNFRPIVDIGDEVEEYVKSLIKEQKPVEA